jgi:hypothetical protein
MIEELLHVIYQKEVYTHFNFRIEIHIYETILFMQVFWIVRQIQISHRPSMS